MEIVSPPEMRSRAMLPVITIELQQHNTRYRADAIAGQCQSNIEGIEDVGQLDDEKVSVFLIIDWPTTHLALGAAKGNSDVT